MVRRTSKAARRALRRRRPPRTTKKGARRAATRNVGGVSAANESERGRRVPTHLSRPPLFVATRASCDNCRCAIPDDRAAVPTTSSVSRLHVKLVPWDTRTRGLSARTFLRSQPPRIHTSPQPSSESCGAPSAPHTHPARTPCGDQIRCVLWGADAVSTVAVYGCHRRESSRSSAPTETLGVDAGPCSARWRRPDARRRTVRRTLTRAYTSAAADVPARLPFLTLPLLLCRALPLPPRLLCSGWLVGGGAADEARR